jgi:ring-1,2-phenylacetyl-CoA epoxidase subunit PaaC
MADDILFQCLLRLGDDSLVLGQRLSELCGHAPALEVDLALANLALDLIGQATLWLELAGEVEGAGRDADALAFRRDPAAFRNCLLVEQPNGDFARTMVRQLLFSTWQQLAYEQLERSSNPRIAEIAAKALLEVRYHAQLAADWVIRLGDGTGESRGRMTAALAWHARFIDELFEVDDVSSATAVAGVAPEPASLRPAFDAAIAAVLANATLAFPTLPRASTGGRRGRHSEHLVPMLAEMQFLQRTYPGAKW